MNIDNLIAEIESSLKQYKNSGLLDITSLRRWTRMALKKFGQSVCTLQEGVVQITDGVGILPEGFHSLHLAVKCSPKGYFVNEQDIPLIQNTLMWKERVERSTDWNSCAPCCKEESEKTIIENVIINGKEISFYYETPILLRLGKSMKRAGLCSSQCKNRFVTECEHEISINKETIFTNFTTGTIYLQFYGLEVDEENKIVIPDTPRGELVTYLEAHLKTRVLEELLTNSDDPNLSGVLQYWSTKEQFQYLKAMKDAKFSTLTPDSYKKLAAFNRGEMAKVKYMLPNF